MNFAVASFTGLYLIEVKEEFGKFEIKVLSKHLSGLWIDSVNYVSPNTYLIVG